MVKFSKFCSQSSSSPHHWLVVLKFREIWPTGNWWNCALLTWQKRTKFCLALQLSLLCRSCTKAASLQQCTQSAPDFFHIGLLLAEL